MFFKHLPGYIMCFEKFKVLEVWQIFLDALSSAVRELEMTFSHYS